ncbi:hypothetical protein IAU60_000757 [Kwoniella sp. DSM 27419]
MEEPVPRAVGWPRPRSMMALILGSLAALSLMLYTYPVMPSLRSSRVILPDLALPPFLNLTTSLTPPAPISPDPRISHTKWLGGVPGFQVFQNIWIKGNAMYLLNPERTTMPGMSRVVSGDIRWEVIRSASDPLLDGAEKSLVLEGSTVFINDGADTNQWHYLASYYHLVAEVLLGAIAALASVPATHDMVEEVRAGVEVPKVPERVVIPWPSAEGWRDPEGLNDVIMKGVFGENVVEPNAWRSLSSPTHANDGWIFMPRAVIVDRWASHRHNPLADATNKMQAAVLVRPHPPFFFTPTRLALFSHLSIEAPPARMEPQRSLRTMPKIVYVDRQNTDRKLSPQAHAELAVALGEMEALGKATVGHKKMSRLSLREQIEAVADADILIGVYGEGMTHQLWMPEGGVIMEILKPESFMRENQLVADVLNHQFIPIWDDRALSREEWDKLPRQHGEGLLNNGEDVPLDGRFLRLLLEEVIQRMTGEIA